jgi:Flp pilus assembly protein TadD
MYYSTSQRKTVLPALYRRLTAFLIISIFSITFPVITFAEILEKTAQEYHQKAYEAQQKGNLEQALTYYSKALTLGLHDPQVFNDLGILYEQLGAEDRAVEHYQEAIRIDPNYLPAYTNLGYFYLNKGDTAEAATYLRKRLDKAPANDPWRDDVEKRAAEGRSHV